MLDVKHNVSMKQQTEEVMKKLKFVAVVGAGADTAAKLVRVMVREASGEDYELEFIEGMAGGMVLGLMDQLRVIQASERGASETSGQLTSLTDVRGIRLPDGRRGLSMTFEHAMRVASALSPDMRRHLRRELETLDRMTTPEPKPGKAN